MIRLLDSIKLEIGSAYVNGIRPQRDSQLEVTQVIGTDDDYYE